MPHVIVKLWPGKSEQKKKRLAQEITQAVMTTLGYGEESVSVGIEEVDAKNWMEVCRAALAQAVFCRRRHQPRRPTLAKIRPERKLSPRL
jgi:4-oxalocrotonate tautomerase